MTFLRLSCGLLFMVPMCNALNSLVDGSNTEVSAEQRLRDYLSHSKYPEENRLLASEEQELEKIPLITGEAMDSATIVGFSGEKLEKNSLIVSFKVKIHHAGSFSFRTYLQSETGRPLIQAMLTRELGRGEQTLHFFFYGKAIRDAGNTGRFVLPGIVGEKLPDAAGHMGRLRYLPSAYRTKLYRSADFTEQDWDSKEKRAKILELKKQIKSENKKPR